MEETEKTVQTEEVKTEEKPVEKAASEETKAAPEKKKKTKKRIRINYKISLADIISTVAMIAVIVFVWVFVACGTGGATKRMAINKYFAAISKNDAKAYKNASYPKKWQKHYNLEDGTITLEYIVDNTLSLQSGAKYDKANIISIENLDKEQVDNFNDCLKDLYGIKNFKVSKICKVRFNIDSNYGGQKQNSGTLTRYLYKYHGKWYYFSDPVMSVKTGLDY